MTLTKSKLTNWIKIKKIITFLSDAICVIGIGMGFQEDSLFILIGRVGVSAILESLNVWFTPNNNN
jgi:hypothetical protein